MPNSFTKFPSQIRSLKWKGEGSGEGNRVTLREDPLHTNVKPKKRSFPTLSSTYPANSPSKLHLDSRTVTGVCVGVCMCVCIVSCGTWLPRLMGGFYKSTFLLRVQAFKVLFFAEVSVSTFSLLHPKPQNLSKNGCQILLEGLLVELSHPTAFLW